MKKLLSLDMLLFICIFLLGFFLRAQETLSKNFLFLIDQGRDMMAIKNIVYGHHITLIGPYTSLQGVFQGPIWYYLLSIPTLLLKGDPWGTVVLMLLIGLATMLTATFFMWKHFGKGVGLITLFLFAIAPQAIAAATFSWNPHPMWLLTVLYIFFLYQLFLKKEKYHSVLWLVIGLMFNFESALAIFIFLAAIIYLLIFNSASYKSKYFLYGMGILIFMFLPQIIFDLRHHFLMTSSILKVLRGSSQGLSAGAKRASFLQNINDHIHAFWDNFSGAFVHDRRYAFLTTSPPTIGIVSFIILFYRKKLSKNELEFLRVTIGTVVIVFALTLLYPYPLRSWFLTGFEVFYLLPLAFLFGKIGKNIIGGLILILLFCIMSVISLQKVYYVYKYPDYGGTAKIKGKLDAIDFIYQEAKGKPFSLFVFTPPVYTDAYDYLTFWRAKTKYHYLPSKNKREDFYLLMEPDPGNTLSYKGWEETVIKTGNIQWTKTLASGLIIQKRTEK